MKKSLLVAAFLTLALSSTTYAEHDQSSHASINSAEKGALATIATIDENEIVVSVVAENKKVSDDVMDFAKMMLTQHGANLTQILEMKNGSLTGGESEKLAAQGKKDLVTLGALQGVEFEHAYVNAMVQGHEGALKLIDTQLMKTAKSDEVKSFLTETRAAVAAHLEHAKKLQQNMKA